MPYEIMLVCGHNQIVNSPEHFIYYKNNVKVFYKSKKCKECNNNLIEVKRIVKRLWNKEPEIIL